MSEIKKTTSSYGNYYFKIGEKFYYFFKLKEAKLKFIELKGGLKDDYRRI